MYGAIRGVPARKKVNVHCQIEQVRKLFQKMSATPYRARDARSHWKKFEKLLSRGAKLTGGLKTCGEYHFQQDEKLFLTRS